MRYGGAEGIYGGSGQRFGTVTGIAITGGTITGTNDPYTVSQAAITVGKAPSGTMANNGAVTFGTAFNRIISEGCYLWYPAGAVAAGVPAVASFLWTIMSSTTLGTVYNSTYTSGTPAIGVQTAFVTTGPGAFTGDTAAVTAITFPIPANALGANGLFELHFGIEFNTTAAQNKTPAYKFGTATMFTGALTTQSSAVGYAYAQNKGVTNKQTMGVLYGNQAAAAQGSTSTTVATEDTTAIVTASITLQTAVATDWMLIERYAGRVAYSA